MIFFYLFCVLILQHFNPLLFHYFPLKPKRQKAPNGLMCRSALFCHNPEILIFAGSVITVCTAMFSDPPAETNPGP